MQAAQETSVNGWQSPGKQIQQVGDLVMNVTLFISSHVLASSCSESRISWMKYKRVIDIRLPLKDRLEFSIHVQCG